MATTPKEDLKARLCQEIDARCDEMLAIADDILRHPETGFREFRTAELVADHFAQMGLDCQKGLAMTGVKARMEGAAPGPRVAVLGEMDALFCQGHPFAEKNGVAHACGHNGQIATMLGVAMALLATRAMDGLAGSVVLMAVPAEELIELQYRLDLRKQGKIEFLGGKQELIRIGAFDDVDMAMMVHTTSQPEDRLGTLTYSSNGTVSKSVQYLGTPSHAGGAPWDGVNALNAAMLGINAMHAQRETFRDEDTVRLHAIITKGGDAVNVVPSDVRLEVRVRGKTLQAMDDANAKVNRALKAGALAVGAKLRVETMRGYLPLATSRALGAVYRDNIVRLIGQDQWVEGGHRTGSTDMGDLEHVMPAIHPFTAGASGAGHGSDFAITDPDLAILNPAKAVAMTIVDLLADEAQAGKKVVGENPPLLTKEQYVATIRDMNNVLEYG